MLGKFCNHKVLPKTWCSWIRAS